MFWSRGAEETYGWSKADAAGKVAQNFLKTEFPLPFQNYTSALMERGRWDGELVHARKDGRLITVLSRQALQRDKTGVPVGILEINIDITAERRLEDKLRQAHKLEAVGTLAGGIAHNFNNILAAIVGNAELALEKVDEASPVQENLDQIIRASFRARDHVKGILAFSTKSATEQKRIHLAPLVRETFNFLRASLPSTIKMSLQITSGNDVAIVEPSQLQQVVVNLGANAAQAMPGGGELVISLLDARFDPARPVPDPDLHPGEYIELSVRDTGSGMDRAVIGRIFEPFFTTREVGKGAGLGLSMAYGIVKACRGAITVESEPGTGSTFRVFLPKAADEVEAVQKNEKTRSQGVAKVLFVDDEEGLRKIAEAVFSRLGYAVTTEGDGESALRRYRDNPQAFDVVVTDYTMPDMTGLALSREILKVRPDMPILLCTGYTDAIDEEGAKAAGIREFLMKPIKKQDLAEVVKRALVRSA